jgi:hypothetical protein
MDDKVVAQVRENIREGERVLVFLDSNHTKAHGGGARAVCAAGDAGVVHRRDGRHHGDPGGRSARQRGVGSRQSVRGGAEFAVRHPEFVLEQPQWPFNDSTLDRNVTHWPSAWPDASEHNPFMVRVNRVAANIISNWGGSFIVALAALAFIPLYIRYLGIGGYGLVGFFITLQSVLSPRSRAEHGIDARARCNERAAGASRDARDLVRTLEIVYWLLAILVGVIVTIAAPFIAQYWVKSEVLAPAVVERSVMLMGIAVALQMPSALYGGGLTGLQRQVLLNSIVVTGTLVRSAGAVLILAFVRRRFRRISRGRFSPCPCRPS